MNEIWERLYREAHRVLKPRKVSEMMETAGGCRGGGIDIRKHLCRRLRRQRMHARNLRRTECDFQYADKR